MMSNERSTASRPTRSGHHEDEFPPLLQQDSSNSYSTLSASRSGDSHDHIALPCAINGSKQTSTTITGRGTSSKQYQPFPIILMKLLQDPTHSDVISFRPDGRSFVIKDNNSFVSVLMPEIFHFRRLDTFFRKLERWGFQILTGEGCYTFFHTEDKFREGDYEMCRKMRHMSLEETKLKSKQRRKEMRQRSRRSDPPRKPRSSATSTLQTPGPFKAQSAAASLDVNCRHRPGQALPFACTRSSKMPNVSKMSDAELRLFANSIAFPTVEEGMNYSPRFSAGNISNGVRASAGTFVGVSAIADHQNTTDDDEHLEQQLHQQRPALPITDLYDHHRPAVSNGTGGGESNKQTTTAAASPIIGSKNKYQPFPVIMMQLLEDPKNFNILSFRPGGRTFVIKDPTTFASKLMPDAFHLRRFEVFLGKLHRWGFRSLTELGHGHPSQMMPYAFYHVEGRFRAGDLELCKSIRRLTFKEYMSRMAQQQQQQQRQQQQLQLQQQRHQQQQFLSRSRHTLYPVAGARPLPGHLQGSLVLQKHDGAYNACCKPNGMFVM